MIKYNQVDIDYIDEETRKMIGSNVKRTCIDSHSSMGSKDELDELHYSHEASARSPQDVYLLRQAGDFGLYRFYIGSIGPFFALVLVILAISFSIFKKMPR
jgi:hypothetical protein